jgi:hypothetical protein
MAFLDRMADREVSDLERAARNRALAILNKLKS